MIPRVLEPEVMDSAEDAHDYDSMDHTEVNAVFVRDFLDAWHGRGPILDVGTGTAQIPIETCRQSPLAEIVAVDAAAHMIALANENVRRAGLEKRIKCELVDAKELPYEDESWAAVMSNSIVHHIPEPRTVLWEIGRVAATGATIFVRDLLRPDSEEELTRIVDTYAAGATDRQRQLFADSLRAALTLDEVKELVNTVGYDPDHVRQTSDRHWTWRLRPGAVDEEE